jgi:hypothetical protein
MGLGLRFLREELGASMRARCITWGIRLLIIELEASCTQRKFWHRSIVTLSVAESVS